MTTIALLTDIHLPTALQFGGGEYSIKRFFGFLNWHLFRKAIHQAGPLKLLTSDLQSQEVDHIFVSGDLVNLGLKAEFETGMEWMETLRSFSDVSYVYGNHDYYGISENVLPCEALNSYMTSDERGAALGGGSGPSRPFVRVVSNIAIIGVNSGVPTDLFKAYGKISSQALSKLSLILHACAEAGLYRCVVMHHPPLAGLTHRSRSLLNDEAFTHLLKDAGAELVLYGHNHRQVVSKIDTVSGICHVVGTPSASVAVAGHYDLARYNLFSISGAPGEWVANMSGRGVDERLETVVDLGTTKLKSIAP